MLTHNARVVLEERYLLKNRKGKARETPEQMFRRVAGAVSSAEKRNRSIFRSSFYRMMSNLEWLPNSPTLFNAGTGLGMLSACFVLPINDSLVSIFNALKETAIIEQAGGGVGFSFSRIRPKGSVVKSTMGVASGPVSFMRIFDMVTEVIKAGGRRRGAMMGVLSAEHPDIMEFITVKSRECMRNFNISVAVTDRFMKKKGKVWDAIARSAWATGDPGVLFIDEINRKNPTRHVGRIEATNPCGEAPMHPYESCNLGSINLARMVKGDEIDWLKLKETVELAVRFLDDVIEVNRYPIKAIEQMVKSNRRIGLGVMGFADMLIMMGIPYDSDRAVSTAEKVMKFISEESHRVSRELGKERGSFKNFRGSTWDRKGHKHMRNATTTAIAPTGTLSIIAGCSSSIEPLFAVSFMRKILGGRKLLEVNSLFRETAKKKGFYSKGLMERIARTGSVQNIKTVPEDVRRLFVTALDIKPEWHVRIQAAFQKYTDQAVSKTVNLPESAGVSDVKRVYELAHRLKCKGVTVYRYGSKPEQVLYVGKGGKMQAGAEYAGGCPTEICPLSE